MSINLYQQYFSSSYFSFNQTKEFSMPSNFCPPWMQNTHLFLSPTPKQNLCEFFFFPFFSPSLLMFGLFLFIYCNNNFFILYKIKNKK